MRQFILILGLIATFCFTSCRNELDFESSIGDLSLELINEIKNRVYNTTEDVQQAKEDSRFVGESSQKTLLFMKLLQIEEKIRTQNND